MVNKKKHDSKNGTVGLARDRTSVQYSIYAFLQKKIIIAQNEVISISVKNIHIFIRHD